MFQKLNIPKNNIDLENSKQNEQQLQAQKNQLEKDFNLDKKDVETINAAEMKKILQAVHILTTDMGSNGMEKVGLLNNTPKWAGNMLKSLVGARWVSSFADRMLNLNELPGGENNKIANTVKNLSQVFRSSLDLNTAEYFANFTAGVTGEFRNLSNEELSTNIKEKIKSELGNLKGYKRLLVTGEKGKLLNTLLQFTGYHNTEIILQKIDENGDDFDNMVSALAKQIQKVTKLTTTAQFVEGELQSEFIKNIAGSISSAGIHISDSRGSGATTMINMLVRGGIPALKSFKLANYISSGIDLANNSLQVLRSGSAAGFALESFGGSKQNVNKVLQNVISIEKPKIELLLKQSVKDWENLTSEQKDYLIGRKLIPVIIKYTNENAAKDRELASTKETLLGNAKQFLYKSIGIKKGFKSIKDTLGGKVNSVSNLSGLLEFMSSYQNQIENLESTMSSEELSNLLEIDKEISYSPDLKNLSKSVNEQIGGFKPKDTLTLVQSLVTQSISTYASGAALGVFGLAANNTKVAINGAGEFQDLGNVVEATETKMKSDILLISRFGQEVFDSVNPFGASVMAAELPGFESPQANVLKIKSLSEFEDAMAYNAVEKGTVVELPNGQKITIVGDINGKIGLNTYNTVGNQFKVIENQRSETITNIKNTVTTNFQESFPQFKNLPAQLTETFLPLDKKGEMTLVTVQMPTNFDGNLEAKDMGESIVLPKNAKIVSTVSGVNFYQFTNDKGQVEIRASLQNDEPGTARSINSEAINFVLKTQDGVSIPLDVSNKILRGGIDPTKIYESVAKANPENSKYYTLNSGLRDGLTADGVEISENVSLRDLVSKADKFTASYSNKYRPGTVAFLNMILASDNAKRDLYINAMFADRRHILDSPGEQAGFSNEYRMVLRDLDKLGVFKDDLNGLKLNEIVRETQLDSGTTLGLNQVSDLQKTLLEAASKISENVTKTGVSNKFLERNQQRFTGGSFARDVKSANTPEEIHKLTKELSGARFDFSGADGVAYRAAMMEVSKKSEEFEQNVPYLNAYIQASGGSDRVILNESGLVEGVKLDEFDSNIGLNLPKLNTLGGVVQALSYAWGIKNGQIPIPLKFNHGGSISFGEFDSEQMDELNNKNNPRYEKVQKGISPAAGQILSQVFKAAGIPFVVVGKSETVSGYAGEIQVEIPKQLEGQLESILNAEKSLSLVLEDVGLMEKLTQNGQLEIQDIKGVIKDKNGNILEGEALENYLNTINTY